MNKVFKKCPMCNQIWSNREQFLNDKNVQISGYMANFEDLELGIFMFNHTTCKGTLSVKAKYFMDLNEQEIFQISRQGTDECLGYCLHQDNLRACSMECECAYVRGIIQTIKSWNLVKQN